MLAISPTPGYNHFMQFFTVGPMGHLHALLQFHFSETGISSECRGRSVSMSRAKDYSAFVLAVTPWIEMITCGSTVPVTPRGPDGQRVLGRECNFRV